MFYAFVIFIDYYIDLMFIMHIKLFVIALIDYFIVCLHYAYYTVFICLWSDSYIAHCTSYAYSTAYSYSID